MLTAIDTNDKMFYRNLTPEQKKEFSPWLAMRYASSCKGNAAEYSLLFTNEIVNKNFSDLYHHPELQWMLLSLCGIGKRQQHEFIRPGKKGKKNKVQTFLSKIYPKLKLDELELLEHMNTPAELKSLARDHGYQESDIKDIFK